MLRDGRPGLWELGIWTALWQVNPWGAQRADRRAAIGHALFANANRDSDKQPQPFQTRDFMPYLQLTQEERDRELEQRITATLAPAARPASEVKAWRKARRKGVGSR
jgi:hypothetical protein